MDKDRIDTHVGDACQKDQAARNADAVVQMEMQLHEQFAQNYNSTFGATIMLFCTMLAVLSAYGYIFLRSSLKFSNALDDLYCTIDEAYTLDALIFVAMAAFIVLTIMKYISLFLGKNQRMEQFVIHAIRKKYYGCDPAWQDSPKIYPRNYTPFGKKDDDIAIGMYGEFIKIVRLLQAMVLLGTFAKVVCSVLTNSNGGCSCTGMLEVYILTLVVIACYGQYNSARQHFIKKYNKRAMEYFDTYCNYPMSEE